MRVRRSRPSGATQLYQCADPDPRERPSCTARRFGPTGATQSYSRAGLERWLSGRPCGVRSTAPVVASATAAAPLQRGWQWRRSQPTVPAGRIRDVEDVLDQLEGTRAMQSQRGRICGRSPGLPGAVADRLAGLPLPELFEAGSDKFAIEGKRPVNAHGAHHGEARRIDERILPLVVPAKPSQRVRLQLRRREQDANSRRTLHRVEKVDRRAMTGPAPEKRPGLATHVVCGYEWTSMMSIQKSASLGMMIVAPISKRNPERRVDESHR